MILLPTDLTLLTSREPGPRDGNVDGRFRVLVCSASSGGLELAVPATDVPLVQAVITGS